MYLSCQLRSFSLLQELRVHIPSVSHRHCSCFVNRVSKLDSFLKRTTPKHGCFLLMSPWRCKQRSIFSAGADSSRCGVSVNQVCSSNCRLWTEKPQSPLSCDMKNNWTQRKYNAGRVKHDFHCVFFFSGHKTWIMTGSLDQGMIFGKTGCRFFRNASLPLLSLPGLG